MSSSMVTSMLLKLLLLLGTTALTHRTRHTSRLLVHRHLLLLHRLLPLPKGLLLCIDVPDVLE
jgi:hypothetical protein